MTNISAISRAISKLDSDSFHEVPDQPSKAQMAVIANRRDAVLCAGNAIPGISVVTGAVTVVQGAVHLLGAAIFREPSMASSGLTKLALGGLAVTGGPVGWGVNAVAAAKDVVDWSNAAQIRDSLQQQAK